MAKSTDDTYTEYGAGRLAAVVRDYWLARGVHDIEVNVEIEVRERDGKKVPASRHVVRSNLKFGFPAWSGRDAGSAA